MRVMLDTNILLSASLFPNKDFLECGVEKPRMMTLTDFESEFMSGD
jgi:predicted nucleic acid-binding protein